MKANKIMVLGLLGAAELLVSVGQARMLKEVKTQSSSVPLGYKLTASCLPNKDQCTHKVGRLWFSVTNYGFFGNQIDPLGLRDCLTGDRSSSAEFPGGSQVEYLFQGSLWIGAVIGADTLVSIGTDGWVFDPARGQFHADCDPGGAFIRRSRIPGSPNYDSLNAVSDQDLIAVMYDTLTDPALVETPDPQDGKPFKPLGLKIIQKSYSWSAGWGQDWVMLDYNIVNVGRKPLTKVFLGVFVDADVGYTGPGSGTIFDDDLSGFKVSVPNPEAPACPDTINLAYVYDADGDQKNDVYTRTSATAVTGIRVVRAPLPLSQVKTSFNWWTPNGTVALDWGPQKVPGRKNFSGGLGQPEGNAMKYSYLSNGELDYDQVWSAVDQNSIDYGFGTGWLPPLNPPTNAIDIANGFDTRYVVGYGPFNLKPQADDPSDTLRLTLAYIAGDAFHRDPHNFSSNLGAAGENYKNPVNIQRYQAGLNFDAVATNARWVQRVFDNETNSRLDTVECGDPPQIKILTRRYGDGIPDFKGPQPPPPPVTQVNTNIGQIVLLWNGKNSETVVDEFSQTKDFEGYRVQMSQDGQNYTIVGSYDKVDWKVYFLNKNKIDTTGVGLIGTWQPTNVPPLTWDEIQRYYAVRWDTCQNKIDSVTDPLNKRYIINRPIDPDRFGQPIPAHSSNRLPNFFGFCSPDTGWAAILVRFRPGSPTADTIFYFARQDYNLGLSQAKLFPAVTDTSDDRYYWYQFKIDQLATAQPIYMAITPFDFGILTDVNRLDPLETPPNSAAQLIYPLPTEESRRYSYKVFAYDASSGRWVASPGIMNYSTIQNIYATLWDTCRNEPGKITQPIDPEKFNGPDNPASDSTRCNPDLSKKAIAIHFCDSCGPGGTPVDSLYYFALSDTFKISVYPNPYRVDNDYSQYENPQRIVQGFDPERHRKLNFINLPAKCVIRIYTLDGDLVQEIRHDKDPAASDAGYDVWDLLTRNAQAVTAGLYLYTVQSSDGIWTEDGLKNTHVGKIVIIK